jgi:serine/threonine protein kinase
VTVPQFVIIEKINEGATTAVYKAHQSVLGRTVLLKILHKHLIDDTELVERFGREARACALIRSEYIVQVYDLTEIEGAPAIVMEYVEGTSLKDVLATEGPLPADRARQMIIETLHALHAAHSCGVIHRDIKPGNILVTKSGRIKVTDFGLAVISVSPTVTQDGAVLGTPAYLPPEHIRGEIADERSDLFSLGTTYLELLTGQRIFEGSSYSACINKILRFEPTVIDELVTDPGAAEVIKRLMHPDRDQRFTTAAEALAALHVEPKKQPTLPASKQSNSRLRYAAFVLGLAVLIGTLAWFLPHARYAPVSSTVSELPRISNDSIVQRPADKPSTPSSSSHDHEVAQNAVAPTEKKSASAATPTGKLGAQDSSSLIVTCSPWGKVYLDNQYLGETPLSGSVIVRSGTHTFNFTNPQFLPIVKTITATPGVQQTVTANFFETAGYLVITVVPWAEVYIDDQYRDTTPMEKPIIVTAGKRKIKLHNPAFTDTVIDVSVPTNDTLHLAYSLAGKR